MMRAPIIGPGIAGIAAARRLQAIGGDVNAAGKRS
jgi:predicted NAD/FAD-dependent oxidoreductase